MLPIVLILDNKFVFKNYYRFLMAMIIFIRYLHCVLLVCKWYVFVIIKH